MTAHRWTISTALAAALALACATPAAADPISTAIVTWATGAAFAATTAGAVLIAASNFVLYSAATWAATKLFGPKIGGNAAAATERQASITRLSIGEAPRQAIFGRAGVGGSLADAVNWGGANATDWEGQAVILADHRCEGLDGVWIGDAYVDLRDFAGGAVEGYNGQLEIHWRPGAPDDADFPVEYQNLSPALAPGALAGLAKIFVAYKADAPDAQAPIWSGRPSFVWVVKGLRLYDPRQDDTVPGGSGPHRWSDPATREWGENAELCRYNYQRGIYAQDLVAQPEMLLIGRGLSALEAPPQNIFAAANLCDEDAEIDGADGVEPRYRVGGVINATDSFGMVEDLFAAAMGGVIVQREGTVAVEPGQGKTPVASLTGADLVVGMPIQRSDFKSAADRVNTILPRYPEPEQKWQEVAADVCRDLTDISLDGGAKEETLPLSLVPFRTQAKRLGEIRRRRARLERSMTFTLPPKWSHLEEADWIEFTDDRLTAGETITFEIVAFGLDAQWRNTVALAEISASVYGFGGAATDPAPSTPVPVPDALSLGGVTATAIQIEGNDDSLVPAIRFEWDAPVASGITSIRAEVRKFGQTAATPTILEAVNAGQADVTNGVGWSATMEARLVPKGAPGRAIIPSPWLIVSTTGVSFALSEIDGLTPKALVALLRAVAAQGQAQNTAFIRTGLEQLADREAMAVKTLHNGMPVKQIVVAEDETFEQGEASILKRTNLIGQVTDNGAAFQLNETTLKVSPTETLAEFRTGIAATFASTSAAISSEITARSNADSALASSLSTVSTTVGGHTAAITTLQTSVNGLDAQWVLTVTSGNRIAGIRTHAGATSSSILFFADAIGFTDGSSNYFPLSISGGVVRMTNVEVDTVKAGSIVTNSLVGGAVSTMLAGFAGGDGASVTINAYGGKVKIDCFVEFGATTGAATGIYGILYANGVEIRRAAKWCPGSWGQEPLAFPVFHEPGPGSVTYTIGCTGTPGATPYAINETSLVVTELKR